MPAVKLSPLFNNQVVNAIGAPASGWKVYTYAAGSSTPLATYTDSSGSVPQSNPIIINSLGFPTNAQIWLQSGLAYKLVLTDASDVVQKTEDNISGVNDTSSNVSQWQASGVVPTYVSANSFTLVGDQTSEFHIGRRLQFTTTAGTVYGQIINSVFTTLTTVTMSMDSPTVLDSGLSTVNLSILRADNLAIPVSAKLPWPFRSKMLNAAGLINQEGYVSGTNTTGANQYTLDQWRVVVSGQNLQFTLSSGVMVFTAPAGGVEQPIEAAYIEGGDYYLSWTGTATATVNGTPVANGGSVNVANNTQANIRFIGGTFSKPQFELRGVTPFETRNPFDELRYCQRYFWDSGVSQGSPICLAQAFSASTAGGVLTLPTPMRIQPVGTFARLYAGSAGGAGLLIGGASVSGSINNQYIYMSFTAIAASVAAGAATLISIGAAGDNGRIKLNARL